MLDMIPVRVHSRVSIDATSGCWIWTGSGARGGYAVAKVNGKTRTVHRWFYELAVGPIPDGMTLDHTCHDPSVCLGGSDCPHRRCVNPAHLVPISNDENMAKGGKTNLNRSICRRGRHDLGEVGIYVDSDGSNRCRGCRAEAKARYAAKIAAR